MAAQVPDHLFSSLDSLSRHAFTLSTPKKPITNKTSSLPAARGTPGGKRGVVVERLKYDQKAGTESPTKRASEKTKDKVDGGRKTDDPGPSQRRTASPAKQERKQEVQSEVFDKGLKKETDPIIAEGSENVLPAHSTFCPTTTPPPSSPPPTGSPIPTLKLEAPDAGPLASPSIDFNTDGLLEIVDLTSDDEAAVQELLDRQTARPSEEEGRSRRPKARTSVFRLATPSLPPILPSAGPGASEEEVREKEAALANELFPPSPPPSPSNPPTVKSEPADPPSFPTSKGPSSAGRRITIVTLDSSSESESEDERDDLANTSVESATSALRKTPPAQRFKPLSPRTAPSASTGKASNKKVDDASPTKKVVRGGRRVSEMLAEAKDESESSDDDDIQLATPRVERRRSPRLSDISDPGAGVLEFVPTPRRPLTKLLPSTPKTTSAPEARPPQVPKTAPPKKTAARHPLSNIVDISDSAEPSRPTSAPTTSLKSRSEPFLPTSKSMPLSGRAFLLRRDALAASLVATLDSLVFSHRLPPSLRIVWSKRLNTTAGRASWRRRKDERTGETVREEAEVELACKVVDDEEKLKQTLAHELCHIASFCIDGELKPPHGPAFKKWAKRVMRARPDIQVSVTHTYEIEYKYKWRCLDPKCGHIFQRHSKSIDPARHGCHCGARLQALERTKKPTASKKDLENDALVRAMRAVELD